MEEAEKKQLIERIGEWDKGQVERLEKLAKELETHGVDLRVEHIYREFNTVADALSNEAVDRGDESGPSPEWGEV